MLIPDAIALGSNMLDEARAYLHIDCDLNDPSLSSILLAAIGHAESFTGQILLQRNFRQTVSAGSGWQRLSLTPVTAVNSATGIPADGAKFPMPQESWQYEIDANGDASVRIRRAGLAGRVEISVEAGIASGWEDLPEALRLAVLRLTGHLYNARDGDDDGPPAAVAALLRPWRRMRLNAGALR